MARKGRSSYWVRFEVVVVMIMMIVVLWDVTPCKCFRAYLHMPRFRTPHFMTIMAFCQHMVYVPWWWKQQNPCTRLHGVTFQETAVLKSVQYLPCLIVEPGHDCLCYSVGVMELPSVLRGQDVSLYSPRWDLIQSPTYHHRLHASPQILSFLFIVRNREPDVSNSLSRVRVETMEMKSEGLFSCFPRAPTFLHHSSKMGVAMGQSTVKVIIYERSANPIPLKHCYCKSLASLIAR